MDQQEFLKKADDAVRLVYKNDFDLLELDANERAIAHRLGVYLEPSFKRGDVQFTVDCEYNRYGEELTPKSLSGIEICKNSENPTDSIVPDILIHIRKSCDKDNLAAFEIKSNGTLSECDHLKLAGLTSLREKYKYEFGLGIEFYPDHCSRLLYVHGEPVGSLNAIELE